MNAGRVVIVNELAADNDIAFHLVRPDEVLRPQAATIARRLLRIAGVAEAGIEGFLG